MLLYFRNQVLSYVLLFGFALILDFFTFHHKFGPFAVIVRDLSIDLSVFLVVVSLFFNLSIQKSNSFTIFWQLLLFMAGFTMQMVCIFTPVRETDLKVTAVAPSAEDALNTPPPFYDTDQDLLPLDEHDEEAELFRFRRQINETFFFPNNSNLSDTIQNVTEAIFNVTATVASTLLTNITETTAGNNGNSSTTTNLSEILTTAARNLNQSRLLTNLTSQVFNDDLPECPPAEVVHIWIEEDEAVIQTEEAYNNLDPWTAVRLFNLLHFAIYSMAEPWNGPYQVLGGPSFSGTLHKLFFGLYMMVVMVVMVNLLIAMMTESMKKEP